MKAPSCEDGRCIDGWLYNGVGGMVFPANKRCECNPAPAVPPKLLADWQVRVVEEKAVLDEKLAKLTSFLATPQFQMLEFEDKCLLESQRTAMATYSHTLQARINRFKREKPNADASKEQGTPHSQR